MISAPLSADEEARLGTLEDCDVLDTVPEQVYDDLTRLAAQLCGTPFAMISLVDRDRQWFKSRVGLDLAETPRGQAFCAYTILQEDLFIVPDASLDERFADNPLVLGAARIRFYAGAVLRAGDGRALGSLCVLDREPRTLDARQQESLRALCRQAAAQIELKRSLRALERAARQRRAAEDALRESEARFQAFMNNGPAAAFIKDQAGRFVYVNDPCLRRFGNRAEDWLGKTDADLWSAEVAASLRAHDQAVLAGTDLVTVEEEVPTPDGLTSHWLSYKFPLQHADGSRELAGLALDITARKRAEQERERLVGELREALADVKTLKGFLPMCSSCKNIRDDAGYWKRIESYLSEHSALELTHGICPACVAKLYPEFAGRVTPRFNVPSPQREV